MIAGAAILQRRLTDGGVCDFGVGALQNLLDAVDVESGHALVLNDGGGADLEDAVGGGVGGLFGHEVYSFIYSHKMLGKVEMDPQVIELIGQNYLIGELLKAGFEVAQPMRDRGVDLIAYLDVDDDVDRFVGIPIQLKAASQRSFSIARKYNKFPNLIMAYVWDLVSDNESAVYALTQLEAVSVADTMGYTKTDSWLKKGGYSTTRPSQKLIALLEPHRMTPEKWRYKLLNGS